MVHYMKKSGEVQERFCVPQPWLMFQLQYQHCYSFSDWYFYLVEDLMMIKWKISLYVLLTKACHIRNYIVWFLYDRLFDGIGKCSYSSGISTRIALAILGVQSAGFALIYGIGKCTLMYSWNLLNERFRDGFLIYSNIFTECTTRKWRVIWKTERYIIYGA